MPASQICVFERGERLGGRIYSLRGLGADGDLVVDSGAYRYSSRGETPLLKSLIEDGLQLPHAVYDATHSKIVESATDPDSNTGYATFVERLMDEATALGVQFFTSTELRAVVQPPSASLLAARDPAVAAAAGVTPEFELSFGGDRDPMLAGALVLNVAQQPLLQILQRSTLAVAPPGVQRTEGETALYMPIATTACKYYVHYENAWWRTLGLSTGTYQSSVSTRTISTTIVILGICLRDRAS